MLSQHSAECGVPKGSHSTRVGLPVVALFVCAMIALPAMAEASAPKLKLSAAKKITTQMAVGFAGSFDGTTTGDGTKFDVQEWSIGPCSRKSRRSAACRFDVYGVATDSAGEEFRFDCWSYLQLRYAGTSGRRLRTRVYGTNCGPDSGGSARRHSLPAEN